MHIRGQQIKPQRIQAYVEKIIPRLPSNQFREHFRMLPETYELFKQKLANALSKQNNEGWSTIPVCKQLLTSLSLLATADSYR